MSNSWEYNILKELKELMANFIPSHKEIIKNRINSNTMSNFYGNRVINDWDSLPQSVVDSPSVKHC